MANIKWIKIATGIFDNWKIRHLKSLPSGHEIVCIWLELLCLAGQQNENGSISFTGKIATTEEVLAAIFNEDVKHIQLALSTFENMGMIEIVDDNIQITNWSEYQSADRLEQIREKDRERKRLKKAENDNSTEIPRNFHGKCSISNSISKSNSYSFSNNSNLDNYKYLVDNNTEYNSIDSLLDNAIRDWLEYKDSKKPKSKNHYDTEKALKTLLNKFVKMRDKYGAEAVQNAVDLSIENLYQGIVWDKLNKPKQDNNNNMPMTDKQWDAV